jgi:hypothetical protein
MLPYSCLQANAVEALCRRNGVFSGSSGSHDLNLQLCEPIFKHLASQWEKTFARRLPGVLQSFCQIKTSLGEI